MNLQLIAKFSLLENDKHIANVEVGNKIECEDLQYSLEELYFELKNKVMEQTPQYVVVDFIGEKNE